MHTRQTLRSAILASFGPQWPWSWIGHTAYHCVSLIDLYYTHQILFKSERTDVWPLRQTSLGLKCKQRNNIHPNKTILFQLPLMKFGQETRQLIL